MTRDIEELASRLKPISCEQYADAAVGVLLHSANKDLEVLVVKRVENSSDPWSGEMAFPGGKRNAEDKNLKQTIVRETLEETNINLLNHSRFLGVLTALTSTKRPQLKILPFIILLEHKPLIRLNSKELETSVWISLKNLIPYKGTIEFGHKTFPAYIIGSAAIWGLTYRILENFEELGARL